MLGLQVSCTQGKRFYHNYVPRWLTRSPLRSPPQDPFELTKSELAVFAIQSNVEGLISMEGTHLKIGSLDYVKSILQLGLTYLDHVYGYETSFLP